MSARYIQSLRYQISQCDFLLRITAQVQDRARFGVGFAGEEEVMLDAIDFLYDLKLGYEREIADVGADMARREGMVV